MRARDTAMADELEEVTGMLDETPKSYPIRCRWCAESLLIDVPFDVRAQAGHAECSRGHVTPYKYDGVTIATEGRRWTAPAPWSDDCRRPRSNAGS